MKNVDSTHPEGPYISRVAWECAKFYQDPKNIQAFKEWLAKKRAAEKKAAEKAKEEGA